MAPASNEEQFKFLISCIRYSNNGKVDFAHVAKECKIVSKGAAAKRYERMMRAHGIAPNAASVKPAPSRNMKMERSDFQTSSPSLKKRKAEAFQGDDVAEDDEEAFGNVKAEKEYLSVKEEGDQQPQLQLSLGEATNLLQYYDPPSSYGMGRHDDMGSGSQGIGFGAGNPGYITTMGEPRNPHLPQHYGFANPCSAGIGMIPRAEASNAQYQPMVQFKVEDQGQSNSPFLVE